MSKTAAHGGARGRPAFWTFWAVVLLGAGPFIVAWVLVRGGFWQPESFSHHGLLVHPARPLADLRIEDVAGADEAARAASVFGGGRWLLVQLIDTTCGEACTASLHLTRQVRLGLGKEALRVQRVLLRAGGASLPAGTDEADLVQARLIDTAGLIQRLTTGEYVPAPGDGAAYLVDPLGNLVMIYRAPFDPAGLRKDLSKLLRASHIG